MYMYVYRQGVDQTGIQPQKHNRRCWPQLAEMSIEVQRWNPKNILEAQKKYTNRKKTKNFSSVGVLKSTSTNFHTHPPALISQ